MTTDIGIMIQKIGANMSQLTKNSQIKVSLNGRELKRGKDFRFLKKKSKIIISKKIKQRKASSKGIGNSTSILPDLGKKFFGKNILVNIE
jgi:hypothetical protein